MELVGEAGQPLLSVIELPVGREVAAVLDAVGIADHAGLDRTEPLEVGTVAGVNEHVAENALGPLQIVDRF